MCNGNTDGYMEWMHSDDCPYCHDEMVRRGDGWFCENCEVVFMNLGDVRREAQMQPPYMDDDEGAR